MIRPIVLVVLDGWGISENITFNAIAKAQTPTIDKLNSYYPHIAVQASGISVGLPWGEPGNSEVGHITLGTGKVIYQNMPRLTMAIQSGEFFKNRSFLKAIEHCRDNNSSLHIMGLIGKGGIHSSVDHLYALLELCHNQKFDRVFIHVFTDGRDSAPTSGTDSIMELERRMENYKIGRIATISGRYWAMDRNNNWDRIEKAYNAMAQGEGKAITNPQEYLRESYRKDVFDEYIEPAVVVKNSDPVGKIQDNDSVIFFNFREDRARQITKAFVLENFNNFNRKKINNLHFVAMTQYEEELPVDIAFAPISVENCLGKILSEHNLKQLRIAETEKFAHVTYFFNGGSEERFPGEDREIIPSKVVDTFDQCPEMSAREITAKAISLISRTKYDFILINYANTDIVGHTGNLKAAISAVETVDECLAKLIPAILKENGCLLITADHGNAEEMKNTRTGEIDTEHSTNPVPLWFITKNNHKKAADSKNNYEEIKISGILSDIAPTIIEILELEKPAEMTGESLLDILK